MKAPKIIYHHIPKCGGTSIVRGLALTFYPMQIIRHGRKSFPAALNARVASDVASQYANDPYTYRRQLLAYFIEKNDSDFVSGHYPFCPILYDKHHEHWSFISLFRDPIKRWYSEYYWNFFKDHEYAKTDLDIGEYFESADGQKNTRSFVNFLTPCIDPYGVVTQEELQNALENLEKFTVIGTLENLEKFRADMAVKFGRKPFFFKQNKSPAPEAVLKTPDTESDFHKRLKEKLAADLEIYDAVLQKTL